MIYNSKLQYTFDNSIDCFTFVFDYPFYGGGK